MEGVYGGRSRGRGETGREGEGEKVCEEEWGGGVGFDGGYAVMCESQVWLQSVPGVSGHYGSLVKARSLCDYTARRLSRKKTRHWEGVLLI